MESSDCADLLEILDWDTRFFGFPVAKIGNPRAGADELRDAVDEMRSRGIRLAYWIAERPTPETDESAMALGGRLVDQKLTYAARLASLTGFSLQEMRLVEAYRDDMPMADLKQLALDSAIYSRFFVDPRFPRDKAQSLFEEWITRSVNGTIADAVLVICQGDRIAGMATLAQKEDTGSIGLVSVATNFRGRHFGKALVRSAQDWCRQRQLRQIQVVTQQANVPACRLYQKCGFEVDRTDWIYHFWP